MSKLENLTELWLNENAITKIEGLDKCINLRSLYICYNEIKKIEGIEDLKNIENLWLCNNQIEVKNEEEKEVFRRIKGFRGEERCIE